MGLGSRTDILGISIFSIPNPTKPEPKFHRKESAVISTVGRDLVRAEFHRNKKISRAVKNDNRFFYRFFEDSPREGLNKRIGEACARTDKADLKHR
uniref:Uncharacterized protein n=1 Tax=Candidatus Kentrum sp. LFY TaxID=2126342 RepID=A0A450UCP0_9GAMM|nr:MAG: hypothetical protein BECKLFY1418A_GA0070994_101026 [Candidatus Kentron sp. LFY]